ncbi:hypothetical protein [Actinoplanes cyaneus]|nr:hypothetical protein [Actinoplanes cyaneus]MCW2142926.1 hypothetical protein [Actinoplanes cyaneus]
MLRLDAVNRRGRPIAVRVECSPLLDVAGGPAGSTVVMQALSGTE